MRLSIAAVGVHERVQKRVQGKKYRSLHDCAAAEGKNVIVMTGYTLVALDKAFSHDTVLLQATGDSCNLKAVACGRQAVKLSETLS
jgi:hypothetical protein